MAHINPKSKNGQSRRKPSTGNARRGNRNASTQARRNLTKTVNTVKNKVSNTIKNVVSGSNNGGGGKVPASNYNGKDLRVHLDKVKITSKGNVIPLIQRPSVNVTPRGNELVKLFNNTGYRLQYDQLKAKQAEEERKKEQEEKEKKRRQQQRPVNVPGPYDAMIESAEVWEHLNDPVYNSSAERQAQLKVLQNYSSSPVVVDYATRNLQHSNKWFVDADMFGDAVLGNIDEDDKKTPYHNMLNEYLGTNVKIDPDDQEAYNMYLTRFRVVQDYFKRYTHSDVYYDASLEGTPDVNPFDGYPSAFRGTTVMAADAPLPPWVENTPENQEKWSIYLHRSDEELKTINEEGLKNHQALERQAAEEEMMVEKNIQGKVGSAASELGQEGAINSLSDAVAASFSISPEEADSHYFRDYFRDYWINPLRTGHYVRFLGNRLMDAMDLIDLPAKGVRAALAAQPHILYDGNQMFEGQEAFVYSGGKERQKLIMENGGLDLYNALRRSSQGYTVNGVSAAEARAKLESVGLLDDYNLMMQEWEEYEPQSSVLGNLKEAYTEPGKDFATDTGNFAADMALDILLDPTMVIGGGAKAAAKGITKNVARDAVDLGIKNVLGRAGTYESLEKEGRLAVEGFIRNMDLKTMLFKKQEDIDRRIDAFVDRLVQIEVNANTNKSFHFVNRQDAMKEAIKSTIHERNAKVNAGIVASSKHGLSKAETNFLKTVYRIGYTADKIDSTLLKLAFPEPFIIRDSYRVAAKAVGSDAVATASKWMRDNIAVGKFISTTYHQRRYKKLNDMRRLFGEEYTDPRHLTLDQVEHFKDIQSGEVIPDADTQLRATATANQKLRSMGSACDNLIFRLNKGTISPDDAMLQLEAELQYFAGMEACTNLDQLDTIIKSRFDGFFGSEYLNFKKKFNDVEEFIAIRKSNMQKDFIDELKLVDDPEKLFTLLKKYHNHLDYSDSDLLKQIDLKYNKDAITPEQLREAFTEIQKLPKTFSTKAELDPKKLKAAIQKSAEVDKRDFAELIDGVSRKTAKEVKELLEDPKYSLLKEIVDNEKIRGFQKIRSILSNSDDYVYTTDELVALFDQTFYDVWFTYARGRKIPSEASLGLEELKDLRKTLSRTIKVPISVNSGAVYRYQLDRMVVFDNLINDSRVLNFFDKFNTDLRPIIDELDYHTFGSTDAVNHIGFTDMLRNINRKIKAVNLFHTLNSKLDVIVNPYQKYAILDYIFGLSHSRNDKFINQLKYDDSQFMHELDNAIYSSYGDNKIGIRNARVRMHDLNNDIWGKYSEELREDKELQGWVRSITTADPADPMSYINLQILQNILIDQDAIKYYNRVNKYHPVVFMHCSTSGLNPANSQITGIAYKQWIELSDEASLRDIFENIINKNNDVNSLRVAMDSRYFDTVDRNFLKRIYDSHLGHTYNSDKDRLLAYRRAFGTSDDRPVKTEEQVMQEFCEMLQSTMLVRNGKKLTETGVPCLVYHDFEGFNMPFFTKKVRQYFRSPSINEVLRRLPDFEQNAENSFERMKYIVNEQALTFEERERVRNTFYDLFKDMDELGEYFRFLDIPEIATQFQTISEYISRGNLMDTEDPILQRIEDMFLTQEESDWSDITSAMGKACREIKDFSDQASDWVLYRASTSPRIGSGLITTNEAELKRERAKECFSAIDRISELCGITTTIRSSAGAYHPKLNYKSSTGNVEIPNAISIPAADTAVASKYPGYYDDPATLFLHEFGHFLQNYNPRFAAYVRNRITTRAIASGDLEAMFEVERKYIHNEGDFTDDQILNEIFVQGLAVHLRKSNFVDRLKKYYPNDTAYHELLDNYAEIAKSDIIYTHSPSEEAKIIEHYQTSFMKITGLDKTSDFAEELAATMRDMVHGANKEWKGYLQNVLSTRINPIRNSKNGDPLQYFLNMKVKHDMTDITSFFKIPREVDAAQFYRRLSLKAYDKMSAMAQYIIQNRLHVLDTAEDYLRSYKADLDRFIEQVKDYARREELEETSISYVNMLREPETATDSYLIARKLYDDIIKPSQRENYNKNTFSQGRNQDLLEMVFVEEYTHFADDDIPSKLLEVLKGKHDLDIWQRSYTNIDDATQFLESVSRLSEAANKATSLRFAMSKVRSHVGDILHLDSSLSNLGISTKADYKEAMLYQHISSLLDKLPKGFEDYEDLTIALQFFRQSRKDYADYYSLRKFITDGEFDKNKLINELLWNNLGCHVVKANEYTVELEDAFKDFVKHLDIPFIGYNFEGDRFIVYIKKGYKVQENTEEGYRYVTGHEYLRSTRNNYESVLCPEYEDVLEAVAKRKETPEEVVYDLAVLRSIFTEDFYNELKSIYNDIDYFSDGATKGYLGTRVTNDEITEFYRNMPDTYAQMEPPNAMLQQDLYRGLVSDPGFVSTNEDLNIFDDIYSTLEALKRSTGDVKLAANFIFGEHSDVQIKDILSEVSNKEALEYFSQTEDFAIVQIKQGNTNTGMFLQQIKPRTEADIELLRNTDAAVVPFELFVELQSRMNYKDANSLMAVFNKALVLFKATSLCKAGSAIRNYIDALTKAVLAENEGGVAGTTQIITRGIKASKEVPAVMMMRYRNEFISARTWDDLVRRYKLGDMTYDDYLLLSGLLDRDKAINVSVRTGQHHENIVSGKSVNMTDLKDEDIKEIWRKYKFSEDLSFGINVDFFNSIRKGEIVPTDAIKKEYDEAYRKVLIALSERDAPMFDKAIDKMFLPFNYSEVSARYAQMLWLRDLGYDYNQSVKRVADTQFRSLPNAHLISKLEMVVPFATFKLNNALFWMRMIEERPSYFRLFEHIYGNITRDNYREMMDQYKEYDIEEDYMLKTGGIPIGGSGLYFKLDPSCLDFFSLFYGGATKGIEGLNPALQYAFKYSMYGLGYNSKDFLVDLDYKYGLNEFVEDTINIMPGANRLYDVYEHFHDKSFLYENAPNLASKVMVFLFPTVFASKLDFTTRSYQDFDKYRASLEKDGLWYDLNDGQIKDLSEKNELGANDPRLNWDDVQYFMMVHFGKVWDSNLGKFVPVAEKTEGGLNQEFDLENDPDAWDKLCAEYRKKGMVFDYNVKHFVLEKDLTPGGLNDDKLSFKKRTRLYKELFGLEWDANQNKYVDAEHYIAGGLNDIDGIHNYGDWNKLKAYRRALYGEVYERFEHPDEDGKKGHFVKRYDPKVVTLESLLMKSVNEDNYYQYVALPRMASADILNCKIKDGFIRTADGRYVLTWNRDYNNRVLSQFIPDSGFGYGYRRRNFQWRNFGRYHGKKFPNFMSYKGFYTNENDFDYFYQYNYNYNHEHDYNYNYSRQYKRSDRIARVRSFDISRGVPYGGIYNKFSFYQR